MGDRLPMSNFDQKLGETNGKTAIFKGPFGDFHPVILSFSSSLTRRRGGVQRQVSRLKEQRTKNPVILGESLFGFSGTMYFPTKMNK